jgi:Fe-S-cluster containining protein
MRVLSGTGPGRGTASKTALPPSGRREDFRAAVEFALRDVLTALHVEDQFHSVAKHVEKAAWFRAVERTWERLEPPIRRQEWQAVVDRLVEISYAIRPYCLRCGECCRGGSPSLHVDDMSLWSQGLLSPRELYTLRAGEPVHLNVEGRLGSLPEELVKIRQRPETGHCIFYQEEEKACRIYEHRPLQCRVQACWDPSSFKKLWCAGKLSRRDLLQDNGEMLELIQAHDERCSAEKLAVAFAEWHQSGGEAAIRRILDQLRYDTGLRSLVQERLGLGERELEFYFGRPLIHIVRAYGLRVDRDHDGTYRLVRDA